ncbi:GPI alpha-1,6-mannosyltransferase 2 isoform X2 [Lithobates pipiens]
MRGSHDPFVHEIIRFSLSCRGLTLIMQVLFNLLIPDHTADAFSPPRPPPSSLGDHIAELLLRGYCYYRFCFPSYGEGHLPEELIQLAKDKGYRVRGEPVPAWCSYRFPLAYSHIQSEYWGVGLFRYFQLRQLPNFFLATPVIFLGICATFRYISSNMKLCSTLGLWDVRKKDSYGFYGPRVFVYVAQLSFLAAFGALCMHVQVVTRLLFSSCPVLFWFCSHIIEENEPWIWGLQRNKEASNPAVRLLRAWDSLRTRTRILLGYFLGYWVIGTALHVNFLPWT